MEHQAIQSTVALERIQKLDRAGIDLIYKDYHDPPRSLVICGGSVVAEEPFQPDRRGARISEEIAARFLDISAADFVQRA